VGVPDIIIVHEGRVYALELKAEGGRATALQLATIAAMEAAALSHASQKVSIAQSLYTKAGAWCEGAHRDERARND
jgi:hypothetical protein